MTKPRENLRRVFYYGYHNDDPTQMFRSSLPIGRVLEDPFDLPPVILCYKLNGEWLDCERGGPVRVVVPEAYGFKSIKWLSHIVLTNLAHANDTYAEQNNDVESPLKTFAATMTIPKEVKAGEAIMVSGYAQVGISGLSKVQVSIESSAVERPENDPYFTAAPWIDAELLAAPQNWAALSDGKIPSRLMASTQPVLRRPGHCVSPTLIGRQSCLAWLPVNTRFAVVRLTNKATLSPCHDHSVSRAMQRSNRSELRLQSDEVYSAGSRS